MNRRRKKGISFSISSNVFGLIIISKLKFQAKLLTTDSPNLHLSYSSDTIIK